MAVFSINDYFTNEKQSFEFLEYQKKGDAKTSPFTYRIDKINGLKNLKHIGYTDLPGSCFIFIGFTILCYLNLGRMV